MSQLLCFPLNEIRTFFYFPSPGKSSHPRDWLATWFPFHALPEIALLAWPFAALQKVPQSAFCFFAHLLTYGKFQPSTGIKFYYLGIQIMPLCIISIGIVNNVNRLSSFAPLCANSLLIDEISFKSIWHPHKSTANAESNPSKHVILTVFYASNHFKLLMVRGYRDSLIITSFT